MATTAAGTSSDQRQPLSATLNANAIAITMMTSAV